MGDGAGVGKGRQLAGLIVENHCQGRKKAIYRRLYTGRKKAIWLSGVYNIYICVKQW